MEEEVGEEVEEGVRARRLVGVQTPGWERCTICLEATGCPHFLCESDERKVMKVWKYPVDRLAPLPGPLEEEDEHTYVEDDGREEKNQNHPKKPLLPLRPVCAVCESSFASVKSLTIHEEHNHTPKQCRVASCGMSFPNTKDERVHFRRKHSSEGKRRPKPPQPRTPCELCQRTYQTKGGLQKHIKKTHIKSASQDMSSAHQNPLPLECNICEKLFKTRDGVRKHQKTHNKGAAPSKLQATVAQPVQPQCLEYREPLPVQVDCDPAVLQYIEENNPEILIEEEEEEQVQLDTSSKKQTVEEILKNLEEASAEEQEKILKDMNIVKKRKKQIMSNRELFAIDAGLYSDGEN